MKDRDLDRKLKAAARRSAEKIAGSSDFLILFNESMAEDPIPLLQMGLAMYMDKPIYLLVPEGSRIPSNLLAVARGIEYFHRDESDPTSIQQATDRLLKRMKDAEAN